VQLTNLSTPQVFDVSGTVSVILQSSKYFALVDSVKGITVWTYEGRQVSNPRTVGTGAAAAPIRTAMLKAGNISLADDVLAVLDRTNPKLVHILDTLSGKALAEPIRHELDITDIQLNSSGASNAFGGGAVDRKLFLIDRNRDLYLTGVLKTQLFKLASVRLATARCPARKAAAV
jgi:intraflagellar transport protein 80